MAEVTRDTKSLVDDFNEQQDEPPKYEHLHDYNPAAPVYPPVTIFSFVLSFII